MPPARGGYRSVPVGLVVGDNGRDPPVLIVLIWVAENGHKDRLTDGGTLANFSNSSQLPSLARASQVSTASMPPICMSHLDIAL